MSAIAMGIVLAVGTGYWIAQLQHDASSATNNSANHAQGTTTAVAKSKGEILYYRNPMGLPDTSPTPKKDSMGMDYIPVYADDKPDDSGVVAVSPVRIQNLGVKTARVEMRAVDATVRATGRIEIDERAQVAVAPRFEGWIEHLHVNAIGDPVVKGQPLFTAYSPELQSTGEELRIAERLASLSAPHDLLASESASRLAEATRTRLRNLQVAGQTGARQVFLAPASGVVLDKMAIEGERFMPGETLFRIADLSSVWIIADVHEQDLARVHVGQGAQVRLETFPGRIFEARVDYLYPTLETATRSTRLRLVLDNVDGLLRPGMFAQVALAVGDSTPKVAVPASAIIDDGKQQIVLLALGEGRFQPQPVTLGQRGLEVIEVLEGVKEGDHVVVSANFLIDSESQLKAAFSNLTEASPSDPDVGDSTRYDAVGTLNAVDLDASSVTLTHGKIEALSWPAMTMDFKISDVGLVKDIALGTQVRFVFEAGEPGEYVIFDIQPDASSTPEHPANEHEGH